MNQLNTANKNLQLYEVLRVTFSKKLQTLPEIEALKSNKTRVFTGCDGKPDICEKTAQQYSQLIASFLASDLTELEQKTLVDRRLLKCQSISDETFLNTTSIPQELPPLPATHIEAETSRSILRKFISLPGFKYFSLAAIVLIFGIASSKIIFQSTPLTHSNSIEPTARSNVVNNYNYIYHTAASEYLSGNPHNIIAHFPNSNTIAIARAQQLTIVQLDSFAETIAIDLDLTSTPSAIAISPDGLQVAIAQENGSIVIWDKTTDRLKRLDNHFPISGLAFTHFSNNLVAVDRSGAISFFSDGKEIAHLFGHESAINALTIDRRDNIVTGDRNGIIKIWDDRGKLIQTFKDSAAISSLKTVGTEFLFTSNQLGIVRKWSLSQGIELNSYYTNQKNITAIDVAGDRLIAGSESGSIKIINLNSTEIEQVFAGTDPVSGILFSNNQKYILGANHREIRVWQKQQN